MLLCTVSRVAKRPSDRASMTHSRGSGHPPGTVPRPPCCRRRQHAPAADRARHRPVRHAAHAAEGRHRVAALRRAALAGRAGTLCRRGGGQPAADRMDLRDPDPASPACWGSTPSTPPSRSSSPPCWAAPGGPPRCCRAAAGCSRTGVPVFAAIGTVLLVVPAGDLGQREHLLVAAILPYLVAVRPVARWRPPGLARRR